MSNQVLSWSIILLPWLTLFFMKKENIKRFMPTALLSIIYSILAAQLGNTLKWWVVKEPVYPFRILPNIIGLNPVMTMWIFKFTYRRFWLYMATEVVANLVFPYLYLGYFLSKRNIFHFTGGSPFYVFLMTTGAGILLYCFQKWQEGIFAQSNKDRL